MEYKDYSLVGLESRKAVHNGLAEATWYSAPVSKGEMRNLLERKNTPAIIDTAIWFFLLLISGYFIYVFWGSWLVVFPVAIYSVLYASVSDSRWHETSHGTAFKTDWMNNWLYKIASFMVFRQSTLWRWSHTRHHSDTIIVGRDPEIVSPRPPDILGLILNLFAIKSFTSEFRSMMLHVFGKIGEEEKEYLPKSEYSKVILEARIWLLIYGFIIVLAFYMKSWLPLFYVGLPMFFGSYMISVYGLTQHAGLAENVLDHRLNCRTVYMNRIHRFLYWNMNYHLEHHMFPLVPYHNLPKLHKLIKPYCPEPYKGLINTWKEIIPALLKQVKDPAYFVERKIPEAAPAENTNITQKFSTTSDSVKDGWVTVCGTEQLSMGEVIRFDLSKRTYAIYRTKENYFYATDGICTHGNTHLSDGLVIGNQIECPKHNGRFNIADGSTARPPVCVALKTYEVKVEDEKVLMRIGTPITKSQVAVDFKTFKVKSNENVATFIKELILEPIGDWDFDYKPGQYVQINIPAYDKINFQNIIINNPYLDTWEKNKLLSLVCSNEFDTKRNYSMASNPVNDRELKFNVRVALPPNGIDCNPGIGSSFIFSLKSGDTVDLNGPFGDFILKDGEGEIVYIGGGAGMAPLKSHISYLFEIEKTKRKVAFWYGARSKSELYYQHYFKMLMNKHDNFNFQVALSEPKSSDDWNSSTGYIHDVVLEKYLKQHQNPKNIDYYLCGPPPMIKACKKMLHSLKVPVERILFDEF